MYNYDLIPTHIRPAVRGYMERGEPVGDFLTAVITNDLKRTVGLADEVNSHRLLDIVTFFYNEVPLGCQGSRAAMAEWIERGGLEGSLASEAQPVKDTNGVDVADEGGANA